MPPAEDPPIGLDTTVASDGAAHAATVDPTSRSGGELLAVGTRIDRYEIVALLGRGGMGSVYRARDTELARDVALKRIRAGYSDLEELRARLRREAQAMARVEHDAVVRVYDVGTAGDQLYVTMELVDGGTLDAWLAAARPWREVVAMFVRAGRGLVAAHDAGLIHRDFKPGNVMVDRRGQPRVTDFGLARSAELSAPAAQDRALETQLTVTGGIVGTPAYMAPEQLDGGVIDARADQFAFCVALWEALYRARPFEASRVATLVALREAIAAGPAAPASSAVPTAVSSALRRGLAESAEQRWPSMNALLAALEAAARPRRAPWLVAAGLTVAATGAAVIAWWPGGTSARVVADAAPSKSLTLGEPASIDRRRADEMATVAILRDGRIARTNGRGVAIRRMTGTEVVEVPSPDGREVAILGPGATGDWLIAYTWLGSDRPYEACTIWRIPIDGAAATKLLDSPGCAHEVDLAPDGETVAVSDGTSVVVRQRDGGERWKLALDTAGNPAWSPDGQRLLVSTGGKSIVLDAATGAEVTSFRGWMRAWLDADRILHWGGVSGARHAELWLLRLSTGEDELVRVFDRGAGPIMTSDDAVIVVLRETQSRLFLAPASPDTPMRLDALTRVDTGALEDLEPTAWTPAGELISEALVGDGPALISTRPGSPGRLLQTLDADNFGHATRTRDHLIYQPQSSRGCEQRVLGLDAAHVDRAWRTDACDRAPTVRCATAGASCVVMERGATTGHRFDPATLTTGEATPAISSRSPLSPDGDAWFTTDGGRVVVHTLDGATTTITPDPALDGLILQPIYSGWGRTSATFLLVTMQQRRTELVELDRTGRWRKLLTSDADQLRLPLPSPDGAWIAIMGANDLVDYQRLPIVADLGR